MRKVDSNWYEARLDNTTKGLVPANHLHVVMAPITTHDSINTETVHSPAPSVSSRPSSIVSNPTEKRLDSRSNDDVFMYVETLKDQHNQI